MRSVHKSYHRSEPWVSCSGLGEIKNLPIAARAHCRRRGKGEGVASSLNSPAWESYEFHTASDRAQISGKKAEKWDSRKTTS